MARMATRALLEQWGVLTEEAGTFESLSRDIGYTERRPDLVITDYRLPAGATAAWRVIGDGRKRGSW